MLFLLLFTLRLLLWQWRHPPSCQADDVEDTGLVEQLSKKNFKLEMSLYRQVS